MKKIYVLFIALIFSTQLFISCNKNDHYRPPTAVETSFNENFPDASDVYWLGYSVYQQALFNNSDGDYTNAYFNSNGLLIITHTDISTDDIPATVVDALKNSPYSSWGVLSDAKVERINMPTLYVFTVANGNEMFMLYYNEEGELDMQLIGGPANNSVNNLPFSVLASVRSAFPSSLVIDARYLVNGNLEVEIIDVSIVKLIVFNSAFGWVNTYWQVKESTVPSSVLSVISSDYASYTIKYIYYLQMSNNNTYYQFVLESSNDEITTVNVSPEGEVVNL